ncbi:MAG: 50S ribosome-binding GTPase [Acidothermales bacterium]|nr:50S ribosome-binding GTPase [Acidothermales bacterium]
MSELARLADELAERLDALSRVVDIAAGRLPSEDLAAARRMLERAETRRRLAAEHTVVALAGSTGSGKSSLFNALSGVDLSAVGSRRPTTGAVHACVWDGVGETTRPLLDWLGVPEQHRVAHDTVLDTAPSPLSGLVLLDLPDHDSSERAHREEVARVVELADMLVWVMDPQKYADRVVHEDFLTPHARYGAVVVVVLNQVDRLDPADADACADDLRRILVERDGLDEPQVISTSATSGAGVDELRDLLVETVRDHRASERRLLADVQAICDRLGVHTAVAPENGGVSSESRDDLISSVSDSAGVETLSAAVRQLTRRRGIRYVDWPVTAIVRRARGESALRLPSGEDVGQVDPDALPAAAPVQLAQVDGALRRVSAAAAGELPLPWPEVTRDASRARADDLVDAVDRALADADLGVDRTPAWWHVVRVVQWLLLACLAGGVGLVVAGAFVAADLLRLGVVLAAAGLVLGLLLTSLSRLGVRRTARHRGEQVVAQLRERIAGTLREYAIEPVENELDAYAEIRRELAAARGA